MHKLFVKIFGIFWIAQSLIFAISTALILRHRFPHPAALFDSFSTSLQTQGQQQAAAYELNGCAAFSPIGSAARIGLLDGSGKPLCGSVAAHGVSGELPTGRVTGTQVGNVYVWSVPVVSASGRHYTFQLGVPHAPEDNGISHDLVRFAFPQLPVAIVISGITTFLLTLLFTQPVAQLRRAARELAHGNLSTRVSEGSSVLSKGGQDEFQAMIHDFNHMAERLESLVAAHKLLLRDVSHELRSPLARLSVALELAREDAAVGGRTEHLDRIERETERLNQLINQLLTLSSMESIDRPQNRAPISLNDLLNDVIADAAYEAQQHGCSVASSLHAECIVLGDRELLHRAVENVVRNAIRYTSPGTTVEISLSAFIADFERTAVIEVRDHGPGIPESELKHVFRPFYRVDPARSRITGGFGVGLAITERAIKLHSGRLEIENQPGAGTRLRIYLSMLDQNVIAHDEYERDS